MSQIKAGDTVQLKSGGPIMTVKDVGDYTMSAGPNPGVHCVWFDSKQVLQSHVFDPKTLQIYSDE